VRDYFSYAPKKHVNTDSFSIPCCGAFEIEHKDPVVLLFIAKHKGTKRTRTGGRKYEYNSK